MFTFFLKLHSFVAAMVAILAIQQVVGFEGCPQPSQPLHAQKAMNTDGRYLVGHSLNYECDQGYEAVLNEPRICQKNGSWSGMESICAKNVALGAIKVTGSVNGIVLPESIKDGFYNTCSTLQPSTDKFLDYSWRIELPRAVNVIAIKTTFTFQEGPVTDFSVFYKASPSSQEVLLFNPNTRPTKSHVVDVHGTSFWESTSVVDKQKSVTATEIKVQMKKSDGFASDESLCEVSIYSSSGQSDKSSKDTPNQRGPTDAMRSTASKSNLISACYYVLYSIVLLKVIGSHM